MKEVYNAEYYREHTGTDYEDKPVWIEHFGDVADRIIADINPTTVLDVGCAWGYLVEALRDRGVEAYGIDISNYAIGNVREDIRPYCAIASIVEGLPEHFPQRFDLVTNIEVLEHLYEEEGLKALENLCKYADKIIFSSSSTDIYEPTHVNVQQREYWVTHFAENGFYDIIEYKPDYVSPDAIYVRKDIKLTRVIENYERHFRQYTAQYAEEIKKFSDMNIYLDNLLTEKENIISHYNELLVDIQKEKDALSDAYNNMEAAYNNISNSIHWKLTKPMRIVCRPIKKLLRKVVNHFNLKSLKKLYISVKTVGFKQTCKKIVNKINGKPNDINYYVNNIKYAEKDTVCRVTSAPIDAISTIITNEKVKRINLVTDSISPGSLLGGVATSLIVATEFANKFGYELRIITRLSKPNPVDYEKIMQMNNILPAKKLSYYSDYEKFSTGDQSFKLDINEEDIFFATSWWSAEAIRKTSLRKRFFYIIQEVETFFYPHGGEHYLCSKIMRSNNIDYIINSQFLYNYFNKYEKNIVDNGIYFEPAFTELLYHPQTFENKEKYKLFFYARPNNPRNLFEYGVNLLEKAVSEGVINMNEWDIYCAGQQIPELKFSNGYVAKNLGQMPWHNYAEFLRDVDLSVSLMYTPHPSYPPYDVACSGGVVVSNKYENKETFEQCKNVILSDLDDVQFMKSLSEGISLAKDMERRRDNYEKSSIPRKWEDVLESTMKFMEERI